MDRLTEDLIVWQTYLDEFRFSDLILRIVPELLGVELRSVEGWQADAGADACAAIDPAHLAVWADGVIGREETLRAAVSDPPGLGQGGEPHAGLRLRYGGYTFAADLRLDTIIQAIVRGPTDPDQRTSFLQAIAVPRFGEQIIRDVAAHAVDSIVVDWIDFDNVRTPLLFGMLWRYAYGKRSTVDRSDIQRSLSYLIDRMAAFNGDVFFTSPRMWPTGVVRDPSDVLPWFPEVANRVRPDRELEALHAEFHRAMLRSDHDRYVEALVTLGVPPARAAAPDMA